MHTVLTDRHNTIIVPLMSTSRTMYFIIIIIIIRQPLCPVVGRRPQRAVSSAISCRSSICPGRLSTAWLVSLVVFLVTWSPSGDMRGPSVALRRLICRAQDHFMFITVLVIYMTCDLSLTQMLVFISLYMMLSILLPILACAAASSVLVWSVSAPYAIAGSTQELYTCLFRQMAILLLTIFRCLTYAAQPAMILHCISLSWVFSLRL